MLPLLLSAASVAAGHKVVDYQGDVLLQRKQSQGWAAPKPVRRRGLVVVSDDRIEVKTGSEALVRCGSRGNRLWSVEIGGPYPISRGCGSDGVLRLARREEGLPGGGDPAIPYLLEPRATTVAGGRIPVRWNGVAGVNGYQVWLVRPRDRRLLWGQRVSNATQTLLPAELGLVPGESYLIVIEADDGSSSQLDGPADQLGIRVATAAELDRLSRQLTSLPRSRLHPEAALLLQADVQRSNGFLAAAIGSLEEGLRGQRPSLPLLLDLGQLYSRVGLNRLAAERYQQAAAMAAAAGDIEGLEEARSGADRSLKLCSKQWGAGVDP